MPFMSDSILWVLLDTVVNNKQAHIIVVYKTTLFIYLTLFLLVSTLYCELRVLYSVGKTNHIEMFRVNCNKNKMEYDSPI